MKNETKRSVTAVLLAAAMLLSTQGITAFADTEKIELPATEITQTTEKPETPEKPAEDGEEGEQEKPETPEKPTEGEGEEQEKPEEKPAEGEGEEQDKPEEKPAEDGEGEVQEKPETETPETPADPSAVAPAAPVAPEMGIEPASIEGDGDYDHTADIVTNSPRVYKWSDWSFTNAGGQYRVILWTQTSNGAELGSINGDDSSSLFPAGTGKRVYTATLTDNNWVFAGWTTNLYHDNGKINRSNLQGIAGKWAFSKDEYEKTPYDGKSSSIQVNAILPWEGEGGINAGNKLYFTLCANFNPLVTVNYDNNQGIVTAANSHGDDKFEAEYAQDKVFTITPKDGFKVKTVTANDTSITANPDGTYTLKSVTEPTTLNVEFEKAEDEDTITKDKIDGAVIVTVACDTFPDTHTYKYSLELDGTNDGEHPNYRITKYSDSATLHLLKDGWLHTFVSQPGHEGHSLVDSSSNYINIQLTFDEASGEWKLPKNATQYNVTINVKCTSKIPEPSTPDVTNLNNLFLEGVTVKCSEKDNHTKSYHFKDIDADNYNNAFYTVTEPELQDGGKYLSVLTVKNQAYVDRYNTSTFTEEPHKLNDKNEQTFKLVWDGIKWSCEESTSIGISVTCGIPDPKPSDGFDWLSSEDYYTVTRDEKAPTKATVSISEQQSINWVNNSNTVGKPQHVLYSAANNSISLTYKDEKWELDYPNNVFCIKVLCPPTDLIMDKLNVSVQCAEKADHELQTFDMIADTFTATVKQDTDNEYVCELTVNSEKYVELYNSRHPGHVPAAPATVVPLKYTGSAWEVIVGKETIPFVVSCEAPDAPTTDEVSIMGKLLTLDCITENVNHSDVSYNLDRGTFTVGEVYTQNTIMPLSDNTTVPAATYHVNVTVNRTSYYLNQYNNVYGTHTLAAGNPVEPIVVLEYNGTEWTPINNARLEVEHEVTTPGGGGEGTNPGGNGGDNDDDDDRYTGGNTVTRTINDDDVPLNDRPTNTTTIDDEDVPLADLPDDTVTIDDGEVPLKANPSTGDSLPFAAMAAAALSLGGVIVLNRKKK